MAHSSDLTRLVPGFDFLQNLMKGAGAGIPGMNQWIAPTIDPAELEKRISELKTVQFWLENNARLLATTIQALEVQRMTLNTLHSMNLPLADLRDALKINLPTGAAPTAPPAEPAAPAPAAPKAASPKAAAAAGTAAPAAVDPMQWWGALTQQFTELATKAIQDGAAESTRLASGAASAPAATAPAPAASAASAAPPPATRRTARAAPKKRAR